MLYHYFGGTATQDVGTWENTGRYALDSRITYQDSFTTTVEGNFVYDHGTEYSRAEYYHNGDVITGMKAESASANSYIKGNFPYTWEGFWSTLDRVTNGYMSTYDFQSLAFSGQDSIDGSSDGGSLNAYTHGSDDLIRLHTGTSNYVDAGSGNDYLQNWSWYANGQYRGGAGNDVFSVGNGTLYGGAGADTFQVVPLYQGGDTTYANILDFEVGVDRIIGSGLELFYLVDENGIWLRADGADWSMRVANVFDPNQLGIS